MKYSDNEQILVDLYEHRKQKEALNARLKKRYKKVVSKDNYGQEVITYICLTNEHIKIESEQGMEFELPCGHEHMCDGFILYDSTPDQVLEKLEKLKGLSFAQELATNRGYLDSYRNLLDAMEEGLNHIENF